MNPFTPWWLAWGAAFVVIEVAAVRARKRGVQGGSLSSLVWRFQQDRWQRVLFIAGWSVLSAHFIFKVL